MARVSSPFVGLSPFDEASKRFFCARDKEIALITANAIASRLTIFYGPSGVGKSSILGAGLIPTLKAKARRQSRSGITATSDATPIDAEKTKRPGGPIPVEWREWAGDPGKHLQKAIAIALREWNLDKLAFPSAWLPSPVSDEDEEFDSRRPARPLGPAMVLVLDQFEELFIQHPELTQVRPAELIKLAADISVGKKSQANLTPGRWVAGVIVALLNSPTSPVNIIFSLREDSLASLDIFRGVVPNFFSTLYRVEWLGVEGVRQAITVPLERWAETPDSKVTANPDLIDALLEDPTLRVREVVRGSTVEPRFETPFLQLVLEQLWKKDVNFHGYDELTLDTFVSLGCAEGIRQDFVEGTLQNYLTDDTIKRSMLAASRLLVSRTQKFPWIASELADAIADPLRADDVTPPGGEEIARTLRELAKTRLVKELSYPEKDEDKKWDGRFEVAHDALAGDIYRWQVQQSTELEQAKARKKLLWLLFLSAVIALGAAGIAVDRSAQNHRSEEAAREAETQRQVAIGAKKQAIAAQGLAEEAAKKAEKAGADAQEAAKIASVAQRQAEVAQGNAEDAAKKEAEARDEANLISGRLTSFIEKLLHENDIGKLRGDFFADPSTPYEQSILAKAENTLTEAQAIVGETDQSGVSPDRRTRAREAVATQFKMLSQALAFIKDDAGESRDSERHKQILERRTRTQKVLDDLRQIEPRLAPVAIVKNTDVNPVRSHLKEIATITRSADACALDFVMRGGLKGQLLVSTSDGVLQFYDDRGKPSPEMVAKLRTGITMAAIDDDGNRVAVAGLDGNVYRIDLVAGRQIAPYTYHSDVVTCVAFSADGSKLASTGADGRLRAYGWNLKPTALKSSDFGILTWAAFDHLREANTANTAHIVCSADDGYVRVYDFKEHRILWPPIPASQNHGAYLGAPVRRAIFSPRDNWVLAAAARQAFLLNSVDGSRRAEIAPPPLDSSASKEGPIVWRAMFKPRPIDDFNPESAAAIGAERDLILLCCDDGSARLYGIPDQPGLPVVEVGKFLYQGQRVHGGAIRTAAWWRNVDHAPFVVRVALASDDGTASVWEIQDEGADRTAPAKMSLLGVAHGYSAPLHNVSFSMDGSVLATGGDDKAVRLWKINP